MSKILNYVTLIILILIIGTQAYNLFYTRNDSFSGVWIVRATISVLIISFLASFIYSAFLHRFTIDQLPACTTIAYFRFRWYIFQMAGLGLSAIPVYLAILQKNNHQNNRLLILLASQIQINLFTVLLSIAFDVLNRYLYKRKESATNSATSDAQNQQQQARNDQNAQFGYFSPKTKGPPPLSSQKSPFEGSKFRYAR